MEATPADASQKGNQAEQEAVVAAPENREARGNRGPHRRAARDPTIAKLTSDDAGGCSYGCT
jgi:hypothetical protein